jgi:hypothetical protein
MRARIALLIAMFLAARAAAAGDIRDAMSPLIDDLGRTERAAFVVRNADGHVGLVVWPSSETDSATWVGRIPDGTVAIAHTHPYWRPKPSNIDMVTARNVKLPVYVVTRSEVWKTAAGVAFRIE